jgi:hypothetical protein
MWGEMRGNMGEIICKAGKDKQEWGKHRGDNLKCGGNMGGNMGEIICKAGKDIQEWGNWGEAWGR